jgi:hypothetical protein
MSGSCDTATACMDGDDNKYGCVLLVNYTTVNVSVKKAILKTNSDGTPTLNSKGIYEVSSVDDTVYSCPPTTNTATGGGYSFIDGFTDKFNGLIVYADDQTYGGIIPSSALTLGDKNCCRYYWAGVGLKTADGNVFQSKDGVDMTDSFKAPKFYLVPITTEMKNAYQSYMSSKNMWFILLVIIVLIVAVVVAYFAYRKYYR